MRALFGFAAANMYMVLESWLNDRAGNATRGRIFASYLSVNFARPDDRPAAVRDRAAGKLRAVQPGDDLLCACA